MEDDQKMQRNAIDLYITTEGVISRLHRKSRLWNRNCIYSYAGQCACVPVLVYCVILCTIIAYFIKIDKKKGAILCTIIAYLIKIDKKKSVILCTINAYLIKIDEKRQKVL